MNTTQKVGSFARNQCRVLPSNQGKVEWGRRLERETAHCYVCGKTALYRVYDKGAVNRGACAEHKDDVRRTSRIFMAGRG